MKWEHKNRKYSLPARKRTIIMGILNTSPDSFSGDGVKTVSEALKRAEKLIEDGADIIDVGGQSTRPESLPVSVDEQIKRTAPVIREIIKKFDVPVSIDTYQSEVAKAALNEGACIVNDISGLRFDKKMAQLAGEFGAAVVLMHIKGTPYDMQKGEIFYEDVVEEIKKYLSESIEIAKKHGVKDEHIIVDPGIGFGKTVEHNLQIIKRLREIREMGYPVLLGPSRKSFIGAILDLPPAQRVEGTLGACAVGICNGADILRVHDVKEVKRLAKVVDAIVRN